jgi:tetratricopeptide (TPR) repeat protein
MSSDLIDHDRSFGPDANDQRNIPIATIDEPLQAMRNSSTETGPDVMKSAAGRRELRSSLRSLPVLLVLLATFFLYSRTLTYTFVYDDIHLIPNNSHLLSWRYVPVYFGQSFWSHIPGNQTNVYRPFFLIWLRLHMVAFGTQPWGWHLTALLANVLVSGLVYLLALRLLKHQLAAVIAAAVFAVHPIHVEAVAWISGVSETLGAGLLLLGFLFYLKQRTDSSGVSYWLVLSLLCFSLAVLTKETEVVLPLLIVAYEYTLGRSTRRRLWGIRLIPYLVILGVYFVLRSLAMHGLNPGEAGFHDAALSLPWLAWAYLKMLFWPTALSPLYDFTYVDRVAGMRFLTGLTLTIGCCGLAWRLRKRWPLATFLAAWFILALAPAVAAFFMAYKSESYHDRYLYLPSFAWAIGVAWLFQWLNLHYNNRVRAVAWGGVALLLAALAAVSYRQQQYWKDDYTLFQHAAEVAPQNERAAGNYASELINRGDFSGALSLSQRMLALHPESFVLLRHAALAAFLLHDFSLAESYYSRAVKLNPTASQMHFALAVCSVNLGHYEAALESLHTVLSLNPNTARVHYMLGVTLMNLGRWSEARSEFSAELRSNPEDAPSQRALVEIAVHLQPKSKT